MTAYCKNTEIVFLLDRSAAGSPWGTQGWQPTLDCLKAVPGVSRYLILGLSSDPGTRFLKVRYFISTPEKEMEINKYQRRVICLTL